jgi:hypothetical protein
MKTTVYQIEGYGRNGKLAMVANYHDRAHAEKVAATFKKAGRATITKKEIFA